MGAFKEREASMLLSALCEYDVPPPLPGSASAPALLCLVGQVDKRFAHNERLAARVAQLRDIATGFGAQSRGSGVVPGSLGLPRRWLHE